jgi:NAD(P)-dependent dehydrogenase (short-subunit alcohol dehydrogenase family)
MQNVLITGGTSGLGYELVKCFLNLGYNVFATGRDSSKLTDLGEGIHFVKMDLANFADVVKGTKKLLSDAGRFNLVINNAGVLGTSSFTETINCLEYTLQVNFLSQLLINDLLIREKSHSDPMMIATVTSPVYKYFKPGFITPGRSNYRSFRNNSESKIYVILIGRYLKEMYPDKNVMHIGLDPGIFSSGISRTQKKWFKRMYSIAAPFMRKPDKIAAAFADVLTADGLRNGLVYRNIIKSRNVDYLDNAAAKDFMDKCYNIIKPFL